MVCFWKRQQHCIKIRKKRCHSAFILLIAIVFISFSAMAEQGGSTNEPENMQSEASRATEKEKVSENERIKLGDVVVTATKTEKVLEDVPGSVSVITQEQMQKQDVKTLDEALQYIPGVFARPKKGLMDSGPSVRMRGFNGNKYTLVLVDGQPINEPYYGEVAFAAMPVDNVERIEVIRGPASALYGGNAMGGVINVITKTPEKLEASLTGGYGTDNTRRIRFSIGDRFWDRLSLQLGLEKETTDGYIATPIVRSISEGDGNTTGGYATKNSTGDDKWVVGDAGENGAEREGINGKVTYDFSSTGELSLNAFYGRSAYDYGEPHTYMGTFGDSTTYADAQPGYRARFQPNDFINYTGIGEVENQGYGVGITELFGPVEIHANATCQFYDKQYTLETGSGDDNYSNSPGMLSISKVYSNSDNTDTEEGVYGSYEPAFLLDGKITYSPIKYMDVSLSVDNILDSEYYQYYAMPGRTFMAELTLKY